MRKFKRKCVVCGTECDVSISDSGRIRSRLWYYGKFNVNSMHTSRYFYEVKQDADGHLRKNKKGDFMFKKVPNDKYDPKSKPKMVEYWECSPKYRKKCELMAKEK